MKAIFRARRLRLASGRASLATLSTALMIGAAFAAPAAAQDANAAQQSGAAIDEDAGVIIVTGFRASVENSIAAKRESNFIVDVVTADDIAGLPDVSIAESLARLPGVTSQRTGGQASAINIRGLSQDLVSATLNGREQVATSGNRVIEFDQYPSELISQAAVYKTPLASHIEGGIAGKVELKTVRPLDNAESFKGAINLRGLYNDRASESPDVSSYGYRVSGSVQAKLLDDTLGVAFGYARLYQPNVATRFVQFDFPVPGTNGSPSRDLNGDGTVDSLNFGFEGIQFGGRETRDAAIGVIQWEPTSNLRVLIDGYYSRFRSDVKRRGIRIVSPQSGDNQFINPVIANNALVGGQIVNRVGSNGFGFGLGTELVNQDESRRDELYTIGGNLAYDFSDRATLSVDVGYSKGTSFFNNAGINLRPYAATPAGLRRADSVPGLISVDYQLNGTRLPTIRSITSDFTDVDPAGGGYLLDGQFLVPQSDSDELFAAAADLVVRFDEANFLDALRVGFRYADRRGDRLVTSFNTFGVPGNAIAVPANIVQQAGFSGGYAKAGLPNFAVVDIDGAFNFAFGNSFGVRQPTDQIAFDFTIDQSFRIDEETYAGYAQMDFDTELGGLRFHGNIGARYIRTDQSSTVNFADPNLVDNPATPPPARENRRPVTRGRTFNDFLPAVNLILDLSDRDILRASYSRQISRPRFFELRGSISVNTGSDGNTSGSGGNPDLSPYRANQFDLAYEHYFGNSGVLAFGAFYKDLSSYIINGTIPQFNYVENGITPPPIPGTNRPGNAVGSFSSPINGDGGYVYGFEIQFSKTFVELPAPFDGLGVQINYAYSKSDLEFPSATSGASINLPLPGLSEHVFNPTVFYEKAGFGARLSTRHRSSFVSPQIGISELILTSAKETVMDAQLSYQFQEGSALQGLKLLAQVNNLTDEPTRTYWGNIAQTGTIQNFGRTFFLGATYEF
ncbi:MAG: TonB-dependent receptor [Blastomonas sp.]|uniref:TonB-dependent receptor n=1 Tax=Blastomonas sp. TaxID=1909299 RepID=UPI0025868502|nr:TonB-dependent receptor [Blastomonas sp.]MCO5794700.1 TonB-dependent receptor [Blastomonas sp.]